MTKRELLVDLSGAQMKDPVDVSAFLAKTVRAWAASRQEEGRPLELILMLQVPPEHDEDVDEILGRVFFDDPEVHTAFLGRFVTISVRSNSSQMPVRGFSLIVE